MKGTSHLYKQKQKVIWPLLAGLLHFRPTRGAQAIINLLLLFIILLKNKAGDILYFVYCPKNLMKRLSEASWAL